MSERNHDSSNAPQPGRRGLPAQQHSPAEASGSTDLMGEGGKAGKADWIAPVDRIAWALRQGAEGAYTNAALVAEALTKQEALDDLERYLRAGPYTEFAKWREQGYAS